MMPGKNLLFAAAFLMFSASASANNKTLFVNGVNAAVHGDFSFDKGEWRGQESFTAFRMKAGFQLIRVGFVGVTIGFQKTGFYTAEKNWTKTTRTQFDYRGPVEELHLFPDAMFGFSMALHQGEGFSFTEGENSGSFNLKCPKNDQGVDTDLPCNGVKTERSRLAVQEITAQVNYNFSPGLQLFIGAGTRHVTGRPQYAVFRDYTDASGKPAKADTWESFDTPKWKMDNQFYLIGLRGTTL